MCTQHGCKCSCQPVSLLLQLASFSAIFDDNALTFTVCSLSMNQGDAQGHEMPGGI